MRAMAKVSRYLGPVLGSGTIQRWLKGKIDAASAGPDAEQRRRGEIERHRDQRGQARLLDKTRDDQHEN